MGGAWTGGEFNWKKDLVAKEEVSNEEHKIDAGSVLGLGLRV
jgi:hypothetical protein